MENASVNETRAQIKRKYGEHSSIRVNEKTPVRNKVIEFVGKRFVTEEEMKTFLTKLTEERGKEMNQKQWFDRNKRFFESFENRGQRVWTLSKYGQRVLELVKRSTQKQSINESIGLFKGEILESLNEGKFERELNSLISEGALAKKADDINMYLSDLEFDKEYDELHDEFEKLLGASRSEILFVDSETNEDDPLMRKVYNYLQSHFNGTNPVETKNWKNNRMGSFTMYDPKLNVIRLDDYGFVAFYFSTDSKF